MKQIININLGGHPVTIDTDAYEHLNRYLDTLEKHFAHSEAREEIMFDIESRMAELFEENIRPRTIVSLADVKAAIDIMGTPEMFGAEMSEEEAPKSKQKGDGFRPGRKLFRDPDNKIIAGVCSGLSAYLGIEDPVWIRLAFVLLTIAGFASVPLYIILMIVIPKAKTSADKLAMRGEPINITSIANSVMNDLEDFSERISDHFDSKKKD